MLTPKFEQKLRAACLSRHAWDRSWPSGILAMLLGEIDSLRMELGGEKGALGARKQSTAELIAEIGRLQREIDGLKALLTCPLCGNSGEVEARICPACTEPSTVVQGLLQNVSILGDK